MNSHEAVREANKEIRCNGCGALIIDQERVHVTPFIMSIHGLGKPVSEFTAPNGALCKVDEVPAICAAPACLAAVLADPTWQRKTLEGWAEERRQREERQTAVTFYDEADHEARAAEINALFQRADVLEKQLRDLVATEDAASAIPLLREFFEIRDALQPKVFGEIVPRDEVVQ